MSLLFPSLFSPSYFFLLPFIISFTFSLLSSSFHHLVYLSSLCLPVRRHLRLVHISRIPRWGEAGDDAVERADSGGLNGARAEGAGQHCHGGVVVSLDHADAKGELHADVPLYEGLERCGDRYGDRWDEQVKLVDVRFHLRGFWKGARQLKTGGLGETIRWG